MNQGLTSTLGEGKAVKQTPGFVDIIYLGVPISSCASEGHLPDVYIAEDELASRTPLASWQKVEPHTVIVLFAQDLHCTHSGHWVCLKNKCQVDRYFIYESTVYIPRFRRSSGTTRDSKMSEPSCVRRLAVVGIYLPSIFLCSSLVAVCLLTFCGLMWLVCKP